MKCSSLVTIAEPNYEAEKLSYEYTMPNDECYPEQWHLQQIEMPFFEPGTPSQSGSNRFGGGPYTSGPSRPDHDWVQYANKKQ
jgi:hypothetical protein